MRFALDTRFVVRRLSAKASVITIIGDLTRATAPALLGAYAEASDQATQVIVLNATALEYMNSQGIAALIALLAAARGTRQQIRVCGLSEHYRDMFEITRLGEMIRVFETEVEAIRGEHGLRSRALGA